MNKGRKKIVAQATLKHTQVFNFVLDHTRTVGTDWVRGLCGDGDVESNPGPVSTNTMTEAAARPSWMGMTGNE